MRAMPLLVLVDRCVGNVDAGAVTHWLGAAHAVMRQGAIGMAQCIDTRQRFAGSREVRGVPQLRSLRLACATGGAELGAPRDLMTAPYLRRYLGRDR